jgi:hypothetical protein
MTNRVAANDMFARRSSESLRCGDQGTETPVQSQAGADNAVVSALRQEPGQRMNLQT